MLGNCSDQNFLPKGIKMALIGVVALVSGVVTTGEQAKAADLIVYYDQAQLLRLPRPVAEIIIGNPSIADVTVQGGNTLVVTGKTFGLTNIIALDAERNIIQDQRIIVERDEKNVVNLTKAGARRSFTCTSSCAPTLTIGDDTGYFEGVNAQNSIKTKFSATGNGGNSGNQ
jgi:Flp pilus assembly secretin CpaC